jgi:hypothetical protein
MSAPKQEPGPLPQGLSPDALDTLTGLTTILTRLRSTIQSSGLGGITGTTPSASGATPNTAGATSHLSLKDVPAATDGLKHKLQKARIQVRGLPDMHRTMPEQEHEMERLQERIRLQREVLESLKNGGQVPSGADDVFMSDGV